MTGKIQETAHARAVEFLAMFGRGDSSRDIAQAMGWSTKYPSHMVQNYVSRLRKRGYTIPPRGSAR